jgi:hypothetical protein
MIPFLYKIKYVLNNRNKKIVLDALIVSHLRYGIELFGFAPSYLIDRLQKVFNKTIKVLFSKANQVKSTTSLCKEFEILNVNNLRNLVIILNNYYLNDFKYKDTSKINFLRENSLRFTVPLVRNTYGLKCKDHYIPTIFNKIPTELQNLKSFRTVKTQIKKWLLTTNWS